MFRRLFSFFTFAAMSLAANAVATNFALQLSSDASVDCGVLQGMAGAESYTVQLWLKPTEWASGKYIFSLGDAMSIRLGSEPSVIFTCAGERVTIEHPDIEEGRWTQLTIICDKGEGKALVNGQPLEIGHLEAVPDGANELSFGGGYIGCIDELRLWNTAIPADYNFFIYNTLNRYCPCVENLVAYFKFDSADCPNIVEQTAVWKSDSRYSNNHGIIRGEVSRVQSDNEKLSYRICGSYVTSEALENDRYYPERYLLSNLFIIGALESRPDGSVHKISEAVDGQLAEIRAAYSDCVGYELIVSVRGHAGWESTYSNAANRKLFVEDLLRLSEDADGVELALEWTYGTQYTVGKLAEEVRKALPQGKKLYVACHSDAYRFPSVQMECVDGFTFRQDGEEKYYSTFNVFKNDITSFRSYGFKTQFILASYSAMTSHGYVGSKVSAAHPARPVSGVIMDRYADSADADGATYYFNSPQQVSERALYCADNKLAGIFCTDVCGDFDPENTLSLSRTASFVINSNVEPVIREVTVRHSALAEIEAEINSILYSDGRIIAQNARGIELYSADGAIIRCRTGSSLSLSGLGRGLYIIKARFEDGSCIIKKILN